MATKQSYGFCEICGHRTTKGHMLTHLQKCLGNQAEMKGDLSQLVQLRIEVVYLPMYWLDIEMKADATLMDLDNFLRGIWLECCGHMSQFHIKDYHYLEPYEASYQIWSQEGSMDIVLSAALGHETDSFEYEYDFGSTTHLKLRVVAKRGGQTNKDGLRLLARNEQPDWRCTKCDQPAKHICVYCAYEDEAVFCDNHWEEHGCDEEYSLPVVNSPRTGVCGYTGPGEQVDFWR
ncbi:MAG: plasmid pRiA4b ORF-3 family protein [Anaerolineales bacterium]|nr:plasmid pRiA4b ORF-3 family protein [Anaerolineales bacterium]